MTYWDIVAQALMFAGSVLISPLTVLILVLFSMPGVFILIGILWDNAVIFRTWQLILSVTAAFLYLILVAIPLIIWIMTSTPSPFYWS